MKNAHSVKTEIGVGDIVAVNCNTIHFTGTDDYIKYHCIIIDNDFCISSGIDCSDIQYDNKYFKAVKDAILYIQNNFFYKDI